MYPITSRYLYRLYDVGSTGIARKQNTHSEIDHETAAVN
jgi:hypothetical protein